MASWYGQFEMVVSNPGAIAPVVCLLFVCEIKIFLMQIAN